MDEEQKAIELLKRRGYNVVRRGAYITKTFEVDKLVYQAFRQLQTALSMKVKDAHDQALCEWIERHSKRKKITRG